MITNPGSVYYVHVDSGHYMYIHVHVEKLLILVIMSLLTKGGYCFCLLDVSDPHTLFSEQCDFHELIQVNLCRCHLIILYYRP